MNLSIFELSGATVGCSIPGYFWVWAPGMNFLIVLTTESIGATGLPEAGNGRRAKVSLELPFERQFRESTITCTTDRVHQGSDTRAFKFCCLAT